MTTASICGLICVEAMGNDEPRMRGPGIHRKAALLAHSPNVVAIDDHERQPESLIQLFFPLQKHRRRGDEDAPDALAHGTEKTK